MKKMFTLALVLLVLAQPSCIVAGGYSSEGGWYIWPGSFLLIIIVVAFLILRRRR